MRMHGVMLRDGGAKHARWLERGERWERHARRRSTGEGELSGEGERASRVSANLTGGRGAPAAWRRDVTARRGCEEPARRAQPRREAPAAQRAVTSRRGERCGERRAPAQTAVRRRSARSHVGCDVAAPLLQTLLSAPRAVARGEEEERG